MTQALQPGTSHHKVEFSIQANDSRASQPSMIRPLRSSAVIRNTSAARDVQGYIRVLHINQPIWLNFEKTVLNENDPETKRGPSTVIPIEHQQLQDFVNQHPRTRTITNHELRGGVTIPFYPVQ